MTKKRGWPRIVLLPVKISRATEKLVSRTARNRTEWDGTEKIKISSKGKLKNLRMKRIRARGLIRSRINFVLSVSERLIG